jgi:hypothetical protein
VVAKARASRAEHRQDRSPPTDRRSIDRRRPIADRSIAADRSLPDRRRPIAAVRSPLIDRR